MTKRSNASKARKALGHALKDYPFMLAHIQGCGGIAFYLKAKPQMGDTLHADACLYPNGAVPEDGQPAMCFACKHHLGPGDLQPEYIARVQ